MVQEFVEGVEENADDVMWSVSLPNKTNFFSDISEELGGELYQSFKDASKSRAIPAGMQRATTKEQRDQAWRTKVQTEGGFARDEFFKEKKAFGRRWQG